MILEMAQIEIEIEKLENQLKYGKKRLHDYAVIFMYGCVKDELKEIQMVETVLPILKAKLERLKNQQE